MAKRITLSKTYANGKDAWANNPANRTKAEAFVAAHAARKDFAAGVARFIGFKDIFEADDTPELYEGGIDLARAAATQRDNLAVARLLMLEGDLVRALGNSALDDRPKKGQANKALQAVNSLCAFCKAHGIQWVNLYGIPLCWASTIKSFGQQQGVTLILKEKKSR